MKNPLPMLFLIAFGLLFVFYYAFEKEKEEMRSDPTLANYVAKCTEWILGSGCKEFEIYKSKDFKELK